VSCLQEVPTTPFVLPLISADNKRKKKKKKREGIFRRFFRFRRPLWPPCFLLEILGKKKEGGGCGRVLDNVLSPKHNANGFRPRKKKKGGERGGGREESLFRLPLLGLFALLLSKKPKSRKKEKKKEREKKKITAFFPPWTRISSSGKGGGKGRMRGGGEYTHRFYRTQEANDC